MNPQLAARHHRPHFEIATRNYGVLVCSQPVQRKGTVKTLGRGRIAAKDKKRKRPRMEAETEELSRTEKVLYAVIQCAMSQLLNQKGAENYSGDEYESEDDIERTAEDEAFIDVADDDDALIAGELFVELSAVFLTY
jgi:hypothetical protein